MSQSDNFFWDFCIVSMHCCIIAFGVYWCPCQPNYFFPWCPFDVLTSSLDGRWCWLIPFDMSWLESWCPFRSKGGKYVSWCTITHVTWCPFVSWAIWVIWIELSWHFSAIYVSWQISLHLFSSCAVVLYLILVLGCKVFFCVSICCNDRARWSWNNCNLCIKLGYYWAWALHPTIPRYQLRSVHINWSQSVSWVTGSNVEHFAFLTVQTSVVFLVHGISIPVRQRID